MAVTVTPWPLTVTVTVTVTVIWPWLWLWPWPLTVTVIVTVTFDRDCDCDRDLWLWPWPWPWPWSFWLWSWQWSWSWIVTESEHTAGALQICNLCQYMYMCVDCLVLEHNYLIILSCFDLLSWSTNYVWYIIPVPWNLSAICYSKLCTAKRNMYVEYYFWKAR